MAGDILVLVEHAGGKVDSVTLQLLTVGRSLATELKTQLIALAVGHRLESISAAIQGHGMDRIVIVDHPALELAAGEVQAQVIAEAARQIDPRFLLIGYSLVGMELTPAVATKLGVNALTNCVNLEIRDGAVTVTRPVFDSTLHAHVALDDNDRAVIALQKGSFAPSESTSTRAPVESIAIDVAGIPARSKVLAVAEAPAGDVDITKVPILVSVGRGIQNAENVAQAQELADLLAGAVSGSRPVIDQGWLPKTRQVGKSGMNVKSKLYLALGISGAPEHVEGMKGAELIVAINTDAQAPIFSVAHYGAVADLFDVLPPLTEEIKRRQSSRAA